MLVTCLLLLLVSQSSGDGSDGSLCTRQCSRGNHNEEKDPCWTPECDSSHVGNCCFKKDGDILVDLRNCDIESLPANAFLVDATLRNQTASIGAICLDENPKFGPRSVSYDTFRGLTGLQTLLVPSTFGTCPGGDNAWENKSNISSSSLLCEGQRAPCNVSAEACPDKSHCVNDGPGLMRCECNDGYYGYKCLKTGQFPYATFYGSLGAATVVLSSVLWFVGRRKIGLHTKQS